MKRVSGVRTINGRKFQLAGRARSWSSIAAQAENLRKSWDFVKIRAIPHTLGSWSCWVSGDRVLEAGK